MRGSALLLLALGCGAAVRVDPSELEGELFLLARVDPNGVPVIPIARDRLLTRAQLFDGLRLDLERPSAESLLVVGLDRAALDRLEPRFAGDLGAIQLVPDASDLKPRPFAGQAEHRLPATLAFRWFDPATSALVVAPGPTADAFRSRTKLVLPVSKECAYSGIGSLHPFAAEARMPTECRRDISFVFGIDAHRALVFGPSSVGDSLLFVQRRGEPFDCTATTSVAPKLRSIAFDPPSGRILLVYTNSLAEGRVVGDRVVDIRTSTVVNPRRHDVGPAGDFSLNTAAIAEDGMAFVGGNAGFTLARAAGSSEWRAHIVPTGAFESPRAAIRSSRPTGLVAAPFVFTGINRYFTGDPLRPSTLTTAQIQVSYSSGFSPDATAVVRGNPPTYWFIGSENQIGAILYATHPSDAAELRPDFPGRAQACLDASHDRFGDAERIAADARATYVLATCNSVVRVRNRDGCVSLHPVPGEDLGPARQRLRAIDLVDDQLFVGGDGGQLYTLDFAGAD